MAARVLVPTLILVSVVAACGSTSTPPPISSSAGVAPSSIPSASSGKTFESLRYHYRLRLPTGWTVSEMLGTGGVHPDEPGVDTFRDNRGHTMSVVAETVAPDASVDTWTCAISQHLTTEHAAPVESTEALTVAGSAARLTRYHVHFDPYVVHYLNVELIESGLGLTLSLESTTGDDAADETLFRTLLDDLTLT